MNYLVSLEFRPHDYTNEFIDAAILVPDVSSELEAKASARAMLYREVPDAKRLHVLGVKSDPTGDLTHKFLEAGDTPSYDKSPYMEILSGRPALDI